MAKNKKQNKCTNRTHKKKNEFLIAFEAKAGNISQACKAIDIGRRTYYDWLEHDKKFAQNVDDLNEAGIDWGESLLKLQMQKGDTTAIIFFLKTKGKKRGYIEKQEFEHSGDIKHNGKLILEIIHVKS